jgi:hypothetical protein
MQLISVEVVAAAFFLGLEHIIFGACKGKLNNLLDLILRKVFKRPNALEEWLQRLKRILSALT